MPSINAFYSATVPRRRVFAVKVIGHKLSEALIVQIELQEKDANYSERDTV